MALLEIITLPHPILRRNAHKVVHFDKDFQKLIDDMIETMRAAPGVGLAAPQVGVSSQLIVVEYGNEEDEEAPKKIFVVANPQIIEASSEMVTGVEGCLSVPNLVGDVERSTAIVLRGLNRFGKPIKIKAAGWLARIFQHEIDHLNSIVFPDRATRIWQPQEGDKIIEE